MKRYTVLGGGSWATAIVKILTENLPQITWYMRNEHAIEHIRQYRHNPNYLSSVELHTEKLHLTSNINEAIEEADYNLCHSFSLLGTRTLQAHPFTQGKGSILSYQGDCS